MFRRGYRKLIDEREPRVKLRVNSKKESSALNWLYRFKLYFYPRRPLRSIGFPFRRSAECVRSEAKFDDADNHQTPDCAVRSPASTDDDDHGGDGELDASRDGGVAYKYQRSPCLKE